MTDDSLNLLDATVVSGGELERRFLDLVAIWKSDRGPHSASARLAEHPAYQEIINMGSYVIPLLLREMDQRPEHWSRALHALTGVNPVPPQKQGDVREMAAAWVQWGRDHGYQW